MAEHGWLSAHLFYPADPDLLLAELVAPLTAELAADRLVERWFFLRYWDGGPHLRLRLAPRSGRDAEVRARLLERAAEFFARHPSPVPVDDRDYTARAAELAAAEGLTDYLRHPRPADSLEFIDYHREHHRYGYGASIRAVETHFVEASRIALALVATGMTAGFRATAAYSMLLVAWQVGDTTRTAARWAAPPPDGTRSPARAAYERQRGRLRAIARAMCALAGRAAGQPRGVDDGPGDGALADWARSVVRLRAALEPLAGPPPATVIDLCAHLMCNRLGVSVEEEAHLRQLAAHALADLTGTDGDAD